MYINGKKLLGTVDPPPETPVGCAVVPWAVVEVEVEVVVPPSTKGVEPDEAALVPVVEPVLVPLIVPVQTAPEGQQAMFPAWSSAQFDPWEQQTSLAPRFPQLI